MQKTQFRGSFKRERLKIYCKNEHLFLINKVAAPFDICIFCILYLTFISKEANLNRPED